MDVAGIIQTIAISLPPLLLALTLHELAHGYVALHFGDETARWAGRSDVESDQTHGPAGHLFHPVCHDHQRRPSSAGPSPCQSIPITCVGRIQT